MRDAIIRPIAKVIYEFRDLHNIPGTEQKDWEFAQYVIAREGVNVLQDMYMFKNWLYTQFAYNRSYGKLTQVVWSKKKYKKIKELMDAVD